MRLHRILIATLLLLATGDAFATVAAPTPVSYIDSNGMRRVWVFVKNNSNGHLAVNRFNGLTWDWVDMGLAPGMTSFRPGKALTYIDSSGIRRIYVFGVDQENKLALRYYNGSGWYWKKFGGVALNPASISAVTYVTSNGTQILRAFATTAEKGEFVAQYWNGAEWIWIFAGKPPSLGEQGRLEDTDAITYVDSAGDHRMDVFFTAFDGAEFRLAENSSTYGAGEWMDHGGVGVAEISPITFTENHDRKIYVYARSSDTLRSRRRVGGDWSWVNSGLPVPDSQLWETAATTYVDLSGARQIHVFVTVNTGGRVYRRSWNGSSFEWINQNKPDAYGVVNSLTALSVADPATGHEFVYLFAVNAYGSLVFNYWSGANWVWANNGQP